MPTNACVFFQSYSACAMTLRPIAGDCCVSCSYGGVPCPPVQQAGGKGRRCSPQTVDEA